MTWITHDETYHAVVADMEKQKDRAAALVAGALLEQHILLAIKSVITRNENIENKLFKGTGPLSSFSAKIDFGFLLGLYPLRAVKSLHTIREIRNEFAHNMQPVTFRSQRVKDLCKNLAFHEIVTRSTIADLKKNLPNESVIIRWIEHILKPSKLSKRQFMRSVQFMLLYLTLGIKLREAEIMAKKIEHTSSSSS